jgi:diadenosine tetraphosphatase ApaH/serine/threonine PP2A family protein phosphatase
MRFAIFADLHANREAMEVCLAHARDHGAERYVFLGDLVGYGADPCWTVDTVMAHAARGAIVLMGNHDSAVANEGPNDMHAEANRIIEWTRAQLNAEQAEFLRRLPLSVCEGDCLFVHATAEAPESWDYIFDAVQAARSLYATSAGVTFCGHVHEPALYNISPTGMVSTFTPVGDSNMPLSAARRWLAIPGSVGQPRDGNPAACYAMYDSVERELAFFRLPYDCESAAHKIIMAGLPVRMGQRLLIGI